MDIVQVSTATDWCCELKIFVTCDREYETNHGKALSIRVYFRFSITQFEGRQFIRQPANQNATIVRECVAEIQ